MLRQVGYLQELHSITPKVYKNTHKRTVQGFLMSLYLSEESDYCRNQTTLVERNKANKIIFLLEISSSCRLDLYFFVKHLMIIGLFLHKP